MIARRILLEAHGHSINTLVKKAMNSQFDLSTGCPCCCFLWTGNGHIESLWVIHRVAFSGQIPPTDLRRSTTSIVGISWMHMEKVLEGERIIETLLVHVVISLAKCGAKYNCIEESHIGSRGWVFHVLVCRCSSQERSGENKGMGHHCNCCSDTTGERRQTCCVEV